MIKSRQTYNINELINLIICLLNSGLKLFDLTMVKIGGSVIIKLHMENKYLTPKCNHNERGRCINCLSKKLREQKFAQEKTEGPKPGVALEKKQSEPAINKCNHGPKAKCINCLSKQNLLQVKCEHSPYVKCPNCANREQYTDFKYYLSRLEQDCPHKKPCPRCVPPQSLYYFINKNCRNHLPYPQAMCNACLPPTVSIRKQTYLHVREVVFKTFDVYRFIDLRDKFAILYGKENVTSDGVVVEVNCLYFPKQRFENGGFEIYDGEFEEKLQVLTETMGLKKVGIMFDSVDLTHQHLLLSAHYQDIYKEVENGFPISRFVTVRLVRHPETGGSEGIQCYMVSDQFQTFEKNSLVYKIPNLNEFGLQVAVDKRDNLPTYLREGIETDRLAFEQVLVWIQCSSLELQDSLTSYPFFNIQQTTLDDIQDYLPPDRYHHYFQFLLDIANRMGLQPCLNLCLCESEQDLVQVQKRIQSFVQQQKTNKMLNQHRHQQKHHPQKLIQSRLRQDQQREEEILMEQEEMWMRQLREQQWQQQMMRPEFIREQKELMKIQEREDRKRREKMNRDKEEQLRMQREYDKKKGKEQAEMARAQQIQQEQYMRQQQLLQQQQHEQYLKEQQRKAQEQRKRQTVQMHSQLPQPGAQSPSNQYQYAPGQQPNPKYPDPSAPSKPASRSSK